ncbi:MAG TPA: FHA domain-containing protein [Fimbriimonas sp.]
MGALLLRLVAGTAAGFLAWLFTEPFAPKVTATEWDRWERVAILLLGALVGLAVGGLDGFLRGGRVHTLRGVALGTVLGAIGITIGHNLGGALVYGIFGGSIFSSGIIPLQMVARTLAFVPIGIFLGAAIGVAGMNPKKIVQGATGGAIGSAVAGLLFDPLGAMTAGANLTLQGVSRGEVGGPSRALTFLLLGGMIALFIGLVELLTRSAWVRLILGRNEGKEWAIDSSQTFIGRSETAQIPLFGDANVAPVHATISKSGGQYWLTDGGSPIGTYVNGQRIQQCPLFHGAQMQIGGFQLVFLMKNVSAPQRAPDMGAPAGIPMQAAPAAPGPVPVATQAYPMPPGAMQPTQAMAPPPVASQPTQMVGAPSPAMPTQAYAAGGFTLIAMDGPLAGQRFPVPSQIELGRESAAVPMGYDTNASRRHAALAPGLGGLTVTDLGSTNGTYVNGQRVQQAQAPPGTLLRIGATTFRVEAA